MIAIAEQMKQPPKGFKSRSVPATSPIPVCIPGCLKVILLNVIRPIAKIPVIIAPAGRLISRRIDPMIHSAKPQRDPKTIIPAINFMFFMT
jgi:hypothetical protein